MVTGKDAECTPAAGDAERQRLIEAAKQVLQRSGWWGFKVEGVLRQAGLSTRSFYRHFEKKNDLLVALLEVELSGAAAWVRRRLDAAGTPADKIMAYVATTIDMAYREDLARPSSLFAAHWRELLSEYPDVIDRSNQYFIAPLADAIESGVATGQLTSADPQADARAIYYLVAGVTADQASLGGATPREEIERMVVPFIRRAIGITVAPLN